LPAQPPEGGEAEQGDQRKFTLHEPSAREQLQVKTSGFHDVLLDSAN
jgi:hypothetical protein